MVGLGLVALALRWNAPASGPGLDVAPDIQSVDSIADEMPAPGTDSVRRLAADGDAPRAGLAVAVEVPEGMPKGEQITIVIESTQGLRRELSYEGENVVLPSVVRDNIASIGLVSPFLELANPVDVGPDSSGVVTLRPTLRARLLVDVIGFEAEDFAGSMVVLRSGVETRLDALAARRFSRFERVGPYEFGPLPAGR
ncbi:MAG: hypothetical protein AAFP86_18090, partial [Planctomycetota bacterium]